MTEQTTEITAYERSVALVKAELTQYKPKQIDTVLGLLQDGNTVPFIARYRKDQTGSLDEVQIREIEERQRYLENFEKRKEEISRLIDEQGKLTPEITAALSKATTLTALEDIYRPYKQKTPHEGNDCERSRTRAVCIMVTHDDEGFCRGKSCNIYQ